MTNLPVAVWKGSEKTASNVKLEIAKRYGTEEAEKYDPLQNCFTLKAWNARGYRVKKGEKAIRSMTLLEVKDPDAKDQQRVVEKRPKNVYLFYYKQVERKKAA